MHGTMNMKFLSIRLFEEIIWIFREAKPCDFRSWTVEWKCPETSFGICV